MNAFRIFMFLSGLLWLSCHDVSAQGMTTTEFTYQGQLEENGSVVSGLYDFELEPYDALNAGLSLAAPLLIEDVSVDAGLFTLHLDFGSGLFDGGPVFLEIRVRQASEPDFSVLSPRQGVTSAPYAIHAETVSMDAIGSDEIANGTISAADVDATQVQRRIAASCVAGQAIRSVGQDGSVQCESLSAGFWQPGSTNSLEPDRSVRVQPGTQFPFVVRHSATETDPQIAITETADSQPARINLYNDVQSFVDVSNPRYWSIEGQITSAPENDRMKFRSVDAGEVLNLTGDGQVILPQLSHAGPDNLPAEIRPDGAIVNRQPRTHYYSIPMTAFGPTSMSQNFFRNSASFTMTETGPQTIYAPVNLPHGAMVTSMSVWFVDDDGSTNADMTFILRYHDHVTNFGFGPMALLSSNGSVAGTQMLTDNSIFAAEVDNEARNYSMMIQSQNWRPGFLIRSIRITYEL